VVIENKPGAGATIGSEIVARAAPDGYTLLLASQTNAISATLYSKLAYDPVEDFAPVSLLGREPGVLVVNPALPVKTFAEFVAYVKERPGQIDYASSGNGSGQHLFAALLALVDRHQDEPHPLQRQRPGDDRSSGRPGDGVDSRHRRDGRAHQGRQAARAGGDGLEALAPASRCADR
jgi:hypothetical protein